MPTIISLILNVITEHPRVNQEIGRELAAVHRSGVCYDLDRVFVGHVYDLLEQVRTV